MRTWKLSAERHAAGQELFGQDTPTGKVMISLDDRPMVVPLEYDDIDTLMSHFEVRSEHSKSAGVALAREDDKQIAALIINAARHTKAASDNSPFPAGGGALGHADLDIDASSTDAEKRDAVGQLFRMIDQVLSRWSSADAEDGGDVPTTDLNVAVKWDLWYALKQYGVPYGNTELQTGMRPLFADREVVSPDFGNLASLPMRNTPLLYNGVRIWNSPHIPSTNITTGEEKYQGDFSNTIGMMWHQDAAARVYKLGVMTEMDRDVRRQADFMVTKMLAGGGTMRGEAAVEFLDSDPDA